MINQDRQQTFRRWMLFLSQVRGFFAHQGFDEVQTPTLVVCPGTEPFLDVFKTELQLGSHKRTFYLPTSPELHLKKLLAEGWEKIFEIRSCFRNGEVGPLHQPEFYMLEWYRARASLSDLQADVLALLERIGPQLKAGFVMPQVHHLSMAELFKIHLSFNLTPHTSLLDLQALANKIGVIGAEGDTSYDDAFYRIFVDQIEPKLSRYPALFLYNYPPSQAALAKLTPDGWGERFEFYLEGVEIANAFHELTDAKIQRQRSQMDIKEKRRIGKEPVPLDEDFFYALEKGMPPSSGIALGLERLFMAITGTKDIAEIKLFPYC